MKTEIIVVIIASVASLIIGIINIIFNTKISSKQNTIELKKTRIDLLENRRQKIEKIKLIISDRVIEVSDIQDFVFEQHFPRMVEYFQRNSSNVFSVGHLLNPEFIKKLKELNLKINNYIALAKQKKPINENEVRADIELMNNMSEQIKDEIDKSLMEIENKINHLLK